MTSGFGNVGSQRGRHALGCLAGDEKATVLVLFPDDLATLVDHLHKHALLVGNASRKGHVAGTCLVRDAMEEPGQTRPRRS